MNMVSRPKILVFDLDGTLVDSARDLVPALNRTIEKTGISPISLAQAGNIVGQGAMKMIERAFDLNDQPLSEDLQQSLLTEFLVNYEESVAEQTTFYEGVLAALDHLASKGWQFAVCTNKYEKLARKLLSELGQAKLFPIVTGGDTFAFRKPDPLHIIKTIELAGGDSSRAIMVGDSVNDIQAAHTANIPVIAVDFGYSDTPVEELNPTTVISHFSELVDSVTNIESDWILSAEI